MKEKNDILKVESSLEKNYWKGSRKNKNILLYYGVEGNRLLLLFFVKYRLLFV